MTESEAWLKVAELVANGQDLYQALVSFDLDVSLSVHLNMRCQWALFFDEGPANREEILLACCFLSVIGQEL
jgi:hypothetical protein